MRKPLKSDRMTLQQLQDQFNMYAPRDKPLAWTPKFMTQTPRAPRKPSEKPRQHEEHNGQADVVLYLKKCCPDVLVASSCNGELWPLSQQIDKGRFFGWMQKLKNRGLLKGDPDLRLTWYPSRCIFLEMKKKSGGIVSDAQEEIGAKLQAQGFKVYVLAGGIDELKEIIRREGIPCRDIDARCPL